MATQIVVQAEVVISWPGNDLEDALAISYGEDVAADVLKMLEAMIEQDEYNMPDATARAWFQDIEDKEEESK